MTLSTEQLEPQHFVFSIPFPTHAPTEHSSQFPPIPNSQFHFNQKDFSIRIEVDTYFFFFGICLPAHILELLNAHRNGCILELFHGYVLYAQTNADEIWIEFFHLRSLPSLLYKYCDQVDLSRRGMPFQNIGHQFILLIFAHGCS